MGSRPAKHKVPLFDVRVSRRARREVSAVLASGWLTSGPRVSAFERAIGDYLNVRHVAAVGSATAGLYLTLRALGIRPGHRVITTPFTFVATVEAILQSGAEPVLVDIDEPTLNLSPEGVADAVDRRTRAIVPVDIAGHPAEYGPLLDVARQSSLRVISDAAHSIAARYRGGTSPHYAHAAVYSLYSTKNLTCGEGGLVVSRNRKLISKVRQLSRHGLTSGTHERHRSQRWEYDAVDLGFKANMSDVHAALGLGQLTVLDKQQARRAALAGRYLRRLADLSEFIELPVTPTHIRHGWHLFIIRLHLSRLKIDRNCFIQLMAERGVMCGVHYRPIFELSYYRNLLGFVAKNLPTAARAYRRVVTLPLYPSLTAANADYVCDCARRILIRHRR